MESVFSSMQVRKGWVYIESMSLNACNKYARPCPWKSFLGQTAEQADIMVWVLVPTSLVQSQLSTTATNKTFVEMQLLENMIITIVVFYCHR